MWVANRRLNILNSINYRAVLLHAGSSQEDVTASIAETEDFLRNLSFPGLSEKEKEVIARKDTINLTKEVLQMYIWTNLKEMWLENLRIL